MPAAEITQGVQLNPADILRLHRGRTRPQDRSVEKEVDEYLNDPETGTCIIQYWQACLHNYYCLISYRFFFLGVSATISTIILFGHGYSTYSGIKCPM